MNNFGCTFIRTRRNAVLHLLLTAAGLTGFGCHKPNANKGSSAFRIIATDTGFQAPDYMSAGVRHVLMENRGSKIHEAMLVKLARGMTPDDYVAAIRKGSSFPEGATDYSGVGLTSPGQTAEMWLKVDPGQYIIICWNDNHPTTVPVHPFTVEDAGAADERVPKEDVIVKLIDYRFEIAGEFRKGEQVIRVETPGPSMHEMDIFRLHEGRTVADLKQWQKNEQGSSLPPADALGGVLDSHDLTHIVWLRKTFTPGRYALHCEMPVTNRPANSHLTHADLGMVREFEIKD